MAVDEALSLSFQQEGFQYYEGVVRFYGWDSPWLSCGYFQNPSEIVDKPKMEAKKVRLVRRPSGGGLVLHGNEITYSLVCFDHIFGAGTVQETYFRLTAFVRDALRRLGIKAAFAQEAGTGISPAAFSSVCAYGRENYDIVVEGRKIGGHAQRRKKHLIFQHGFIPLHPTELSLAQLVQKEYVQDASPVFLADLTDKVEESELKRLLGECLEQNAGVKLYKDTLTPAEREAAGFLQKNKYSTYEWNYCRRIP